MTSQLLRLWTGARPTMARVFRRVIKEVSHNEHRARKIRASYDAAAEVVRASTGRVVATGPFAGMRYVERENVSWEGILHADAPFLLGSYEAELHDAVEKAISRGYRRILDIGSAEGYYAVGLAMRLPRAEVFAFDIDPTAREVCRKMAEINGVADRVRVEATATPERLSELIVGDTLLVCDCEGCELSILDPRKVPELVATDMIVELHDFLEEGITPTMTSRFARSHDLRLVPAVIRDPQPYVPWLGGVPVWVHPWIVAEFRGGHIEPHHAEWGLFRQISEESPS